MPYQISLGHNEVALVDDSDFADLNQYVWHVKIAPHGKYAARTEYHNSKGVGVFKTIRMHSQLLGEKPGYLIDHISRNGLDNRRCNLRWVTKSQSCMNRVSKNWTLGHKGVCRCKNGAFRARIQVLKRSIHLGYFDALHKAISAYNDAALKLHGEFAVINDSTN